MGSGDAGASRQTRANDLLECLLVLANLHGLTANGGFAAVPGCRLGRTA